MNDSFIPAYWWRKVPNFGDQLAPALIEHFLGRRAEWSERGGRLLTVGSILQPARPGDIIWGSGGDGRPCGDLPRDWSAEQLTFLAVRGPLTKAYVESRSGVCPPIYGDPGLLLPQLLPLAPEPTRPIAAMPHLDDDAGWQFAYRRGIPLINPRWPWQRVARAIVSTAHLVTSSLHGVVAAEAYGVPVTRVRFTRSPKFDDYYAGLAREPRQAFPWEYAVKQPAEPFQQPPPANLLPALLEHFR